MSAYTVNNGEIYSIKLGAYTVDNGEIFRLLTKNILTFSSNNDSIKLHETKIIEITKNGTGNISIINHNPSVISATLSENTITITGLTDGNALITVNVAKDFDYASASAIYKCSITKLSNNATLSSNYDSILEGGTKTVTITRSGTGNISIVNNNPSVISATLSGNTIYITGNVVDRASVTINVAQTSEYSGSSITYTCYVYKLGNNITLSSNNDTILKGDTKAITITRSGTGNISIVNNNPSVIGTTLSGNTIYITGLTQGNASITVNVAESTGYYSGSVTYNCVSATVKTLSECTPAEIQRVARNGSVNSNGDYVYVSGSTYYKFSVGDKVGIEISACTMDKLYISAGTYYAFIIGFNHNSTYEGTKRIHFQLYKNSSGKDYAFGKYDKGVRMNTDSSSGWKQTPMRITYLPALLAAMPTAWRNVISTCTKYTNNTGNSNTQSDITATSDKLWLLSEFEVFGTRTYANQYEQNKQAQYDYYKNGNPTVRYASDNTDEAWFLRSPRCDSTYYFCSVHVNGSTVYSNSYAERGVAPGFTIS